MIFCNDSNEFQPTLMRFEAMSLMKKMYSGHQSYWGELKTKLEEFIESCKAKNLTDAVS